MIDGGAQPGNAHQQSRRAVDGIHTGQFRHAAQFHGLADLAALLPDLFVHRQTEDHREVRSYVLSGLRNEFHEESCAVFQASAVFIGAVVEKR